MSERSERTERTAATRESFGYFGSIGAQLSTIVTIASGVAYVIGVLVTDSYWRRLGTSPAAVGVQTADRIAVTGVCLLYTSPSPRDRQKSRMPSSA